MNKKIYNKLVRDNIPEIIKQNGDIPYIKILNKKETLTELNNKLKEEVNEYLNSTNETFIEELTDIVEVINSILQIKNVNKKTFEEIRKNKNKTRGSFKKRIFLKYTISNKKD